MASDLYLATLQEERQAWELLDPEDRPAQLPSSFNSLREVPGYSSFIKERFERCLDLYLCPRTRRRRPLVKDPESLVPQLPSPKDLRPFPTTLMLRYQGHTGSVRAVALSSVLARFGSYDKSGRQRHGQSNVGSRLARSGP